MKKLEKNNQMLVGWGDGITSLFIDTNSSALRVLNYEKDTSEVHRLAGGKLYYKSLTGYTGEGFIERLDSIIPVGGYRVELRSGWTYGPTTPVRGGGEVEIFAPTNNAHFGRERFVPFVGEPIIVRRWTGDVACLYQGYNESRKALVDILNGGWPEHWFTFKKNLILFSRKGDNIEIGSEEVEMRVSSPQRWGYRPRLDLFGFFRFPEEAYVPDFLEEEFGDYSRLLSCRLYPLEYGAPVNGVSSPKEMKLIPSNKLHWDPEKILVVVKKYGLGDIAETLFSPRDTEDVLEYGLGCSVWGSSRRNYESDCGWKVRNNFQEIEVVVVSDDLKIIKKFLSRLEWREGISLSDEDKEKIFREMFYSCRHLYGKSSTLVTQPEWALSSRNIVRELRKRHYKALRKRFDQAVEAWRK